MAKWLERLTAVGNINGSSRTLGSKLECSLTVHPAVNGYLVVTLGKLKVARKGTGHPTSLCHEWDHQMGTIAYLLSFHYILFVFHYFSISENMD